MKKVTVYTTDPCSLCVSAKALLDKRGIDYDEINLARDPDGRAELAAAHRDVHVPADLIGEEPIGGFNELLAADREGRLSELLAA